MIERIGSEDIRGTVLQGQVEASYDELVEAFGEPTPSLDTDKTHVEWLLSFGKDVLAAIYDWKIPKGTLAKDNLVWNVGGNSHMAVVVIEEELSLKALGWGHNE